MYADLLSRALGKGGKGEDGGRSYDLLLADLVHSRARLRATLGTTPVAEALARELTYDAALIRLCDAVGLVTSPERFDRPGRERARLEEELARLGAAGSLLLPA